MRKLFRFMDRNANKERGITGLETAIILIAFVVVASVFAFVVLSTGLFSSERGKETVYAGLQKTRGNLELRGSVIGNTGGTRLDSIVMDLGNAAGGDPVNLDPAAPVNKTVIALITDGATENDLTYTVDWIVGDTDNLLEPGELAEVTVTIPVAVDLVNNDTFTLEVRPPLGAYVVIQRTMPAGSTLDTVINLR